MHCYFRVVCVALVLPSFSQYVCMYVCVPVCVYVCIYECIYDMYVCARVCVCVYLSLYGPNIPAETKENRPRPRDSTSDDC